jgi:lipoate-protein ligase A
MCFPGGEKTVNQDLLECHLTHARPVYRIYEPAGVCIVLGAGRKNKGDVILEAAQRDRVPVLVRKGGGGTVLLSPGMIVLALVTEVDSPFQNREYARRINGWQKQALSDLGVKDLADRGISDVALGEKKIIGTSIFRRRNVLFYQSSLLVSCDVRLFSRYLSFPSSVPDYRRGRSHEEFCTTLRDAGYEITVRDVALGLREIVSSRLPAL